MTNAHVTPPRRLRERYDYEEMSENSLIVETPDFKDFSNDILDRVYDLDVLLHKVKHLCIDRGFRAIMPQGKGDRITFNCVRGGKKKTLESRSSKINCPFSVMYKFIEMKVPIKLLDGTHSYEIK